MAGGFIAFRCCNFENTAEREQFRELSNKLRMEFSDSEDFCLFIGNYNIYDCEFDSILVKQDAIIAVEFKNYGGKVIANENDNWTADNAVIRGGSRKTVYQQARVNHVALRNGLKDAGLNPKWIKDIPTLIVFNHSIKLDNRLSNKVKSWLYITDNDHFVEKVSDITCKSTDMTNLDIINLAILLNLNNFIDKELSSFEIKDKDEGKNSYTINESQSDFIQERTITTLANKSFEGLNKNAVIDLYKALNSYDRYTPNHIYNLRSNQVFVFGTDTKGSQKYGASGIASKKFGARMGVTSGPTGMCYALPTKGFSINDLSLAVEKFILYARSNNQYSYMVTPVGCGHAGHNADVIAPLFKDCLFMDNVWLPEVFIEIYKMYATAAIEEKHFISDNNDKNVFTYYSPEVHDIIRLLIKEQIPFNQNGGFRLTDEGNAVIAEAELGIESEKVVFLPFNSQSELAFKNAGYEIMDVDTYLKNKKEEKG